jgi:hypothetical protein
MAKKKIIIALANLMAFGSILTTIYANLGSKLFWSLLIPCSIIFATNVTVFLSFYGERK